MTADLEAKSVMIRELPVLKIKAARAWKAQLGTTRIDDLDDYSVPTDIMLDLLLAYDTTGVLGGREAIEEVATDVEVFNAFQEVLRASFPFVSDPLTVIPDFGRIVVASLLARGMNGHSPTGASTPMPSQTDLPTNSSSSSGSEGTSG